MDRRQALRTIDATLKAAGFVYTGPGACEYEGPIAVHGKPVQVLLKVPDVLFATKPIINLKDRSQIPAETLAHVEEITGICYASGAGLPLDIYKPGEAILRVIDEVRRTLELSYAGRGKQELIDEYQQYWKPTLSVRCFLPKKEVGRKRKASLFVASKGGEPKFVGLSEAKELTGFEVGAITPARVLPVQGNLHPAASITIPHQLAQLRTWYEGQAGIIDGPWAEIYNFLLDGGTCFLAASNAFLGFRISVPAHIAAAVKKGSIRKTSLPSIVERMASSVAVERLSGRWSSLPDIVARNNPSDKNLSSWKVAIVGCGTIGSHLARLLVQTGAGCENELSLFDPEILTEGNIGRHLLGLDSVGDFKSEATAKELKRFHPQVKINAYVDSALDRVDLLRKHDLVIDATGEWNVQSNLNNMFLNNALTDTKALLHSWVFMNGASVQSFLNLRDEFACFRCLKPVFDGPWRFPAGDERDELNLQPASCGDGSFIPFTVDASTTAASLAARAALDWANGAPGARLRTVVVDYNRGRVQKPRSPSFSPSCPACSPFRSRE
ncbi:UBA/THIF-type NAD/FAD binding protein [Methylobacterium sp. GXF4]|uniref:ThiF family adenylyltransferase n=1 Tax=Methylobacterium sp. GXF4 TaxID=1096546 RepID=UPI00026986F0|nr:ThiF family adenylyltransferase [Methylobacterium sp. GXF4]EIZ82378.1 UBA/THIF-type NAD/FAD binding protein [Methylobacterium sp. GXF4]